MADAQSGLSEIDEAYVRAIMGQRDRALHELAEAQAQVFVTSRQLTAMTSERDELRKAFDAIIARQAALEEQKRRTEAAPTDISTGAAAPVGMPEEPPAAQ